MFISLSFFLCFFSLYIKKSPCAKQRLFHYLTFFFLFYINCQEYLNRVANNCVCIYIFIYICKFVCMYIYVYKYLYAKHTLIMIQSFNIIHSREKRRHSFIHNPKHKAGGHLCFRLLYNVFSHLKHFIFICILFTY